MGKMTIHQIGTLKIKIDTKDDDYSDKKDPHVSFERKGQITLNHLLISEADHLAGRDAEEKEAIRWVQKNKSEIIQLYNQYND